MENLKEKLKNTSFLIHVSDDEIINLLKKCGYSLDTQIFYKSDGARKPIQRTYDPKTHKIILEVCCKKDEDTYIHNILISKLKSSFANFDYDLTSRLIFIKDYDILEMPASGHNQKLQEEYVNFMYNKFGERYRVNYNKFVNKYNKSLHNNPER